MRVLFLLVLVFAMSGVLGVEGVIPGSYEVAFEPGLEKDFVFVFVLDEEKDVSVEGDLAEFVEVSKKYAANREEVTVSLRLPESLDRIGVNEIWISAGNVRSLIKVHFPYPDRFVGLEMSAPNVNQGEDVDVGLRVSNLGREDVFVNVSVGIYEWDDVRGELVEVFELGGELVNVSGKMNIGFVLNSSNYSAGDYIVVANVDYGDDVIVGENIFRLGEYRVGILNYTNEFRGGKINRFEIEVENLWNEEINEVYIGVEVMGSGEVFDTGIVNLGAWEKETLVGYLDARDIERDVDIEFSLYYGGSSFNGGIVGLIFLEGLNWFFFVEIFFAFCILPI